MSVGIRLRMPALYLFAEECGNRGVFAISFLLSDVLFEAVIRRDNLDVRFARAGDLERP